MVRLENIKFSSSIMDIYNMLAETDPLASTKPIANITRSLEIRVTLILDNLSAGILRPYVESSIWRDGTFEPGGKQTKFTEVETPLMSLGRTYEAIRSDQALPIEEIGEQISHMIPIILNVHEEDVIIAGDFFNQLFSEPKELFKVGTTADNFHIILEPDPKKAVEVAEANLYQAINRFVSTRINSLFFGESKDEAEFYHKHYFRYHKNETEYSVTLAEITERYGSLNFFGTAENLNENVAELKKHDASEYSHWDTHVKLVIFSTLQDMLELLSGYQMNVVAVERFDNMVSRPINIPEVVVEKYYARIEQPVSELKKHTLDFLGSRDVDKKAESVRLLFNGQMCKYLVEFNTYLFENLNFKYMGNLPPLIASMMKTIETVKAVRKNYAAI